MSVRVRGSLLWTVKKMFPITFINRRLFYVWNEDLAAKLHLPPVYVLKHVLNGQWWPEGDPEFHSKLRVDTLLLHGLQDALISTIDTEHTHMVVLHLSSLLFFYINPLDYDTSPHNSLHFFQSPSTKISYFILTLQF